MIARRVSVLATAMFLSQPASATAVRFVWSGTTGGGVLGSSSIDASGRQPETLTLDLVLDVDSAGVGAIQLPIKFDLDLGDELNLLEINRLNYSNPAGVGPGNPPGEGQLTHVGVVTTQESVAGSEEGQIFEFEAFSLGSGPTNATLTFARIVFSTNPGRIQSDGADIDSGPFLDLPVRTGFLRIDDQSGGIDDFTLEVQYGSASVNLIPEPTPLGLLGLGIASLAMASRRGVR
jgi:hypothetical protein